MWESYEGITMFCESTGCEWGHSQGHYPCCHCTPITVGFVNQYEQLTTQSYWTICEASLLFCKFNSMYYIWSVDYGLIMVYILSKECVASFPGSKPSQLHDSSWEGAWERGYGMSTKVQAAIWAGLWKTCGAMAIKRHFHYSVMGDPINYCMVSKAQYSCLWYP